jgi:hypothetical protein
MVVKGGLFRRGERKEGWEANIIEVHYRYV